MLDIGGPDATKSPESVGDFELWCGRGDSNPHGIATASPSSWKICCAVANGRVSYGRMMDTSVLTRTPALQLDPEVLLEVVVHATRVEPVEGQQAIARIHVFQAKAIRQQLLTLGAQVRG